MCAPPTRRLTPADARGHAAGCGLVVCGLVVVLVVDQTQGPKRMISRVTPPHQLPPDGMDALIAHWNKRRRDQVITMPTIPSSAIVFPTVEQSPPTLEIGFGVALIEAGAQTDEGVLIASVTPAWERFLKMLAADAQAFMQLDPYQMQQLIAGAYVLVDGSQRFGRGVATAVWTSSPPVVTWARFGFWIRLSAISLDIS